MTDTFSKSSPDRSRLHLGMSHVVSAALIVTLLYAVDLLARPFAAIAVAAAMIALLVMFFTRKSDEWIASLWTAGASAGFIGAIGWLLFVPFAEGVVDGFRGETGGQDVPNAAASIVALGCFVIAYNLKRLRGI